MNTPKLRGKERLAGRNHPNLKDGDPSFAVRKEAINKSLYVALSRNEKLDEFRSRHKKNKARVRLQKRSKESITGEVTRNHERNSLNREGGRGKALKPVQKTNERNERKKTSNAMALERESNWGKLFQLTRSKIKKVQKKDANWEVAEDWRKRLFGQRRPDREGVKIERTSVTILKNIKRPT